MGKQRLGTKLTELLERSRRGLLSDVRSSFLALVAYHKPWASGADNRARWIDERPG